MICVISDVASGAASSLAAASPLLRSSFDCFAASRVAPSWPSATVGVSRVGLAEEEREEKAEFDDDGGDEEEEENDEEDSTNSTWKFSGGADVVVSTFSSASDSSAAAAVSDGEACTFPFAAPCMSGGGGRGFWLVLLLVFVMSLALPSGGRGEAGTGPGCSNTGAPCGVTKWTSPLTCGATPGSPVCWCW